MLLPKGVYESRYKPDEQTERERAKDRVVSQMRVFVDKEYRKSDSERREMEKAVAEMRRRNSY